MARKGLVLILNPAGRLELVWLSTDVDADARRQSDRYTTEVVEEPRDEVLLDRFVDLLRSERPRRNAIVVDEPDHPHLVLTRERFPRLLATRRPSVSQRAFGPFLPRTAARRLHGLAGQICKLRSCTIDVDGSFAEPCGEHGAGRCIAPCVASLCSPERYETAVVDATLLVEGRTSELVARMNARIATSVDALEFETAAALRDDRDLLTAIWPDLRLRAGLAGSTDVVATHRASGFFGVVIATAFRGRVLGRRTFVASCDDSDSDQWLLAQILAQAYRRDAPSRISSPIDGPQLGIVVRGLSRRSGHSIAFHGPDSDASPMLRLAETDAGGRLAERFVALGAAPPRAVLDDLAAVIRLPKRPRTIGAIDVSHIRGEAMTAALIVCRDALVRPEDSSVWFVDETNELRALESAVRAAASIGGGLDLLVVDGGKPQFAAASRALVSAGRDDIPLLAVVKPSGRPREVSYFIAAIDGVPTRIQPRERSEGLLLAQHLRDEAHEACNAGHRTLREHLQFAIPRALGGGRSDKPIVVPTRFDEPDGAASDLRPILPVGRGAKLHPRGRTRTRRPNS